MSYAKEKLKEFVANAVRRSKTLASRDAGRMKEKELVDRLRGEMEEAVMEVGMGSESPSSSSHVEPCLFPFEAVPPHLYSLRLNRTLPAPCCPLLPPCLAGKRCDFTGTDWQVLRVR
jgi:hypothetical protein